MLGLLGEKGIEAQGVKRGLDHGVWAGFKCSTLLFYPPPPRIHIHITKKSTWG